MSSAPAIPAGGGSSPPKTVKELIAAWQSSGQQALHLRRKLKEVAQYAQRYRRDILFLAQQNQLRKQQADDLRARLVAVLERQQTAQGSDEEIFVAADQESVPAELVHKLLKRLRDSQAILEEYDTLLQFREKQVQELLAAGTAPSGSPQDFLVGQLRQQLSQARHRVRLLTRELVQQSPGTASSSLAEYQERVRQLEILLTQTGSGSSATQIAEYEDRIRQLDSLVAARELELREAQRGLQESTSPPRGESGDSEELLEEIAALQDELGRLQEDVSLLQKENDGLRIQADPEALRQATERLKEAQHALEQERVRRTQLESVAHEVNLLRQENVALKTGSGDPQRMEKLEAAVVDLHGKLQLAATKYQEVKQALLDKHRELNELKSKNQESEKKSEFLVPVVQTLEAALNEARAEAEKGRNELSAERQKCAQLEKMAVAGAAPAGGAPPEEIANMESKLKEARRSAVRAQAEAGVKRKEAAKLQEELNLVKATLAAAEQKLKQAGL